MPLTPAAAKNIQAKPARIAALPTTSTQSPTIANGDMSQGTDVPLGWRIGWTGSGKLNLTRDTHDFASAPAALRLESTGGTAYGNAGHSLVVTDTPFMLSGKVKSSGKFKEARVAVQAFDGSFKQVAFIQLADASDAGAWKTFSGEVRLPKEAKTASLTVILNGDGKVWLDDVSIASEPEVFLSTTSTQ
jgi:endoglucanase